MSSTQWFTRHWPTVPCRLASKATLSLVPTPSADETSTGGIAGGSITVIPNDTLEAIRDRINQNTALQGRVTAEVVPEGNGKKLRIQQVLGEQLVITQTGGTDAIAALGLDFSENGYSTKMRVSDQLVSDPSRISRGQVQFDQISGNYLLSPGDNQIASQMAEMLSGQVSFKAAGSLSGGNSTFGDFSASIVSYNSTQASGIQTDFQFQSDLKTALELKHASLSGVNLDEEMSSLLVYQQTYAASAKVISTTQQMFDILNDLIR